MICRCGHSKEMHTMNLSMFACSVEDSNLNYVDNCIRFIPDNLKYLEELYNERLRAKSN